MQVNMRRVVNLTVSEVDDLDPIRITISSTHIGDGQITLECTGKLWSSRWYAMRDQTTASLFCSCNEHYLAKKLSDYPEWVIDYERIESMLQEDLGERIQGVFAARRDHTINRDEIQDCDPLVEKLVDFQPIKDELTLQENSCIMQEIYGSGWYDKLPTKRNPEYSFLCKVILAVQYGLRVAISRGYIS